MANVPTAAVPEASDDGFVELWRVPHLFAMDLIAKNLQMNGISVRCASADASDDTTVEPRVFVHPSQLEQARTLLSTLDLLDFTNGHGI